MSDFTFSQVIHEYPLTDGEIENFQIKERELVCDWIEKKISLVKPSYLYPGRFKPWNWQREPINAFNYWSREILVGPVQTFKSGITDCQAYYSMCVLGLNGMIAYVNEKKVLDAFDLRYVPMIKSKENPALNNVWDGKEDSLSKNQLKLKTCTWKIASANNKDDLAGFPAPITIGSEVGKWKVKTGQYNPVVLLRGRQDSSFAMGKISKNILESSPYEEGDLLYQEVFREGTIILQPHYRCLYCGKWQTFTDYQIKLRDKELKGRPAKIRELKENAVYYECIHCKHEISESERGLMSEGVIWAASTIEEEAFKQKGEKIEYDGHIKERMEGGVRLGYDTVCYWWNRLSDVSFPFYECLARFFESLHDDERKKSYENETMARWWKKVTGRIREKYLMSKKIEYYQWGEKHVIPEDVLIITLGIDTQDDGFYYSFIGWGYWNEWTVLRHGFIPCERVERGYEYQVLEKLYNNLNIENLVWCNGEEADFIIGGIDRGGHRADDVDYIVKHFPGGKLIAVHGDTSKRDDGVMIYPSKKGNWHMIQSDPLSQDVTKMIESDRFHLPMDVEDEFVKQITRQFHQKEVDKYGRVTVKWIHNYMGPDHYRDTLNINLGVGKLKKLDKILLNENYCEALKEKKLTPNRQPVKKPKQKNINRNNGYFTNLNGRLR